MEEQEVTCPFCAENFTLLVDPSVERQDYIEDCFVCCRPIRFDVSCADGAVLGITANRD